MREVKNYYHWSSSMYNLSRIMRDKKLGANPVAVDRLIIIIIIIWWINNNINRVELWIMIQLNPCVIIIK